MHVFKLNVQFFLNKSDRRAFQENNNSLYNPFIEKISKNASSQATVFVLKLESLSSYFLFTYHCCCEASAKTILLPTKHIAIYIVYIHFGIWEYSVGLLSYTLLLALRLLSEHFQEVQ